MFSGIVEELGTIERIERLTNLARLFVRASKAARGIRQGDSISVSGVCLTVTTIKAGVLCFDCMKETLDKTTLGRLKPKDKVNLERALRLSDRISGHFVTGHIDGVGKIEKIIKGKNYVQMHIGVNRSLIGFIVPKGSICVDGVSLTVGTVGKHYFSFYLIPYTKDITTLGFKKEGGLVNVETDILAKYVLNKCHG
ncbi:MAG TPA: riboflavin synthase [Candidatus Omnitrophota bacterium]|nr:riboflavin synthase [Candidatus Omnitrophota bacterium]